MGFIPVSGGRVWYEIAGDGPGAPLLLLHGGPGSSTASYGPLRVLGTRRPVIFYDQLGSYRSDHPKDPTLWRAERFVEELHQVRGALGLERLTILGHSWGSMLLALYLRDPQARRGVKAVVFSSPCLDAHQWRLDQEAYLRELPPEMQAVLRRAESDPAVRGTAEYEAAVDEFSRRHLCRRQPVPEGVEVEFEHLNHTVYEAMWGPNEFEPSGSLKDFDATPWIGEIGVPALFTCGRYDEATPQTTAHHASLVPGAVFHVFEESAHKTYAEEPGAYVQVVGDFLDRFDPPSA